MVIKKGVVVDSDDVLYDLIEGNLKPEELLINRVEIEIVENSLRNIRNLMKSLEKAGLTISGGDLYF